MKEKAPKHGQIVVVTIPARKERRRWCGACQTWTWEAGGFGTLKFRHGKKRRKPECPR